MRNVEADQLTSFGGFEYKTFFICSVGVCSVTESDMKPEQKLCESHNLYIKMKLFLCKEEEECIEVPPFEGNKPVV